MPLATKEEIFSTGTDLCAVLPLAADPAELETRFGATTQLRKNSRQGFTRKNLVRHQDSAWSNSGTALGIEPALRLEGIRSRCTGKERDSESGLDNFGARYDSSQYGRFMSPDPLGGKLVDPQTLNKYSYVGNNPINFTDPTGLYSCRDDNNQCQTKQDVAFEKSLDSLRNSDNADVARAAGAYGAAKADNGVTVGFADLSTSGENGKTVSTIGTDANGNLRANSDVTINSKINGDSYDAAVGHEGSHAADAQDVARSGFTQDGQAIHAGMNITPYQSEVRAWGVTNTILKAGNFTQGFGCGATTCKLGASPAIGKDAILPGQIPGAIDQILANQSVYNQGGRPMGPNNQGPSVVNGVTPSASVPH